MRPEALQPDCAEIECDLSGPPVNQRINDSALPHHQLRRCGHKVAEFDPLDPQAHREFCILGRGAAIRENRKVESGFDRRTYVVNRSH